MKGSSPTSASAVVIVLTLCLAIPLGYWLFGWFGILLTLVAVFHDSGSKPTSQSTNTKRQQRQRNAPVVDALFTLGVLSMMDDDDDDHDDYDYDDDD